MFQQCKPSVGTLHDTRCDWFWKKSESWAELKWKPYNLSSNVTLCPQKDLVSHIRWRYRSLYNQLTFLDHHTAFFRLWHYQIILFNKGATRCIAIWHKLSNTLVCASGHVSLCLDTRILHIHNSFESFFKYSIIIIFLVLHNCGFQ